MNRKFDWAALLLFTALLFGAVVRFWPAATNGFPINDGGMFYVMIRDLKANGLTLPSFTSYNSAQIPFAYPPLGFYIAALLSTLTPVSELQIVLWLPALINTLSILAFFKLAEHTLGSRIAAALAAVIYALTPGSFVWQVMGGGITRAFGVFFLLLFLWQEMKLFAEYQPRTLLLTILFGAGAVLSHPQTALHAALGGAMVFFFYGFHKRGMLSAMLTALGVALLSAPWWGAVLSRHGVEPFLSAGQTSQRTLDVYLGYLKFNTLEKYLLIPTYLFALIGIWKKFARTEIFLVVWGVLSVLVDPRGGDLIIQMAVTLFAGMGLLKLAAWISRSDGKQAEAAFTKRGVQALLFGFIFYSILGASIFDFQLVNTSLKAEDLQMIEWVKLNVKGENKILLATGREFSMSDPMQEWFPALTGQVSLTTMQGLEWTLKENFFPWYAQLTALQKCANMACVDEWSTGNSVEYDYLIVSIPTDDDKSDAAKSLQSLGADLLHSSGYEMIYSSDAWLVFERMK